MNTQLRAFTLIELLVVIAIIGVLSAVILASLNSARTKGSDASVKDQLRQVQVEAAIFLDTNGSYAPNSGGTRQKTPFFYNAPCTDSMTACDQVINNALNSLVRSQKIVYVAIYGSSGYTQLYAIAVPLSDGSFWCIDSAGDAMQLPSTDTNVTVNQLGTGVCM